MTKNALSQMVQKWVARGRVARPGTGAARKPARLRVEEVEQRLAPATLPVPSVSATTTVANTGGASSPQVVVDPTNPNTLAMVYTTGTSLQAQLSIDGGVTWQNFRLVQSVFTDAAGNRFQGNALADPNISPLVTDLTRVEYTNFSAPSIAFARTGLAANDGTIYLTYLQHNADKTSGAVVVEGFNYNRVTQTVTQNDLDPATDYAISGTSTERFNLRFNNFPDNKDYVLYQWVDNGTNINRGLNPYIAVDNNLSSFQDPATLTSGPTDTLSGRGVYVVWNDDANAPTVTGDNGYNGAPYTRNALWLAESVNGGLNFSTPVPVNDGGHFTQPQFGGSAGQIVFSPSENNSNTNVTPGQMSIIFQRNDNTIVQDRTRPDNGDPTAAVVSNNYFRSENYNTGTGRILEALAPPPDAPGGTPDTPRISRFEIPVNRLGSDPTFTRLSDLNVTLALTHPDVSQLSIVLIAPDGTRVQLLNNRTDPLGNVSGGNGNVGLLPSNDIGVAQGIPLGNNTNFGNVVGAIFDQEAPRQINDRVNVAPYIGSFRPEAGSLAQFYGRTAAQLDSATANWALEITDNRNDRIPAGQQVASQFLRFWSLQFTSVLDNGGLAPDRTVGGQTTVANAADQTYPTRPLVSPTFGIGPGVSVAYDTSLGAYSPFSGRLYAVYTAPGTSVGDPGNIYLTYSDDNGTTWSPRTRVNDDSVFDNFTEGNRTQYQPSVAVDPVTGTVVVMWYDARNDAANARATTYIATSIDGGDTFSPQTYLNNEKTAVDQIIRGTVVLEPIPTNIANISNGVGTGIRQALVVYGGVIKPFWTGNLNSGGSSIFTANVRTAAGPRVFATDMGVVTDDAFQFGTGTYNNTVALDGTRQIDGFYVEFDRLVDVNSFTAADVEVQFRSPDTQRGNAATRVAVGAIEVLDATFPVTSGLGATASASRFFVRFATRQSAVGTYSWAIGPNVNDRVRSATTAVYRSLDTPAAIPDNSNVGLRSTIAVPAIAGNPTVQNLQVGLNITHTYDGDLRVTLIAPDGVTRVVLSNRHGGNGDNFVNTRFRDSATLSIAAFDTDANGDGITDGPPYNGLYRPDGSLANFNGQSISGNWTLLVQDVAGGDVGTLNSWSLTFLTTAGLPVTVGSDSNRMDQDADSIPGEIRNDVFTNPRSTSGTPFTLDFDPTTLPLILPGVHVVSTAVPGTPGDTGNVLAANTNNTVLNGTASQISVTFDRDVNPASFTAANILRMTGPVGVVTGTFTVAGDPASFNAATGGFRTFVITFPTQQLSGSYTIEFGPNASGNSIRAVDAPRYSTLLPAGASSLTVNLNRDPGTPLTVADVVSLSGPDGPVTPTSVTRVSATQYQINFSPTLPNTQLRSAGQYLVYLTATSSRYLAVAGTGQAIDTDTDAGLNVLRGASADVAGFTVTNYGSTGAVAITPATATTTPTGPGLTPSVAESLITIADDFVIDSNPTGNQQIQVGLNIDFPRDIDLDIDLVSPAGTVVRLFTGSLFRVQGVNNNEANFTSTVLLDRVNDPNVTPILQATVPFTPLPGQAFSPQTPLAAFEGQSSRGVWTLRVTNNRQTTTTNDPDYAASGGTPRIRNWSLVLPHSVPGTGLGEAVADRFSASLRIFTQNPTNPLTQDVWTPVGPAPTNETANSARVSTVAVDPSDPSGNTVYLGVAGGGIWKTSDFLTTEVGGPHYQPLTDFGGGGTGRASALNVSNITVFPFPGDPDRSTIFALTGEPGSVQNTGVGLIRSLDGGRTWKVLDSRDNTVSGANTGISLLSSPRRDHLFVGTTGYKIIADPNLNSSNKVTLYMALSGGTGAGVWRSLDTGDTWQLVRAGQATDVVLSAGSASPTGAGQATVYNGSLNRLYAAFQGEGVYRTNSALTALSMDLLAGASGNTLIRDVSIPGTPQVTVNNLNVTPNGAQGRVSLAVPALTGNALQDALLTDWVYALTTNGLYVTKDSGASWTLAQLPMTTLPTASPGFGTNDETKPDRSTQSSAYTQAITVSPLNPNIVYVAGRLSLRVDMTTIRDAQNFTFFNNSDNVGSAVVQPGTPGGVIPGVPGARGAVLIGGSNFNTYASDFINLTRDFNNPFNTNATIRVQGTGFNPNNGLAGSFTNDGADVRWSNFEDLFSTSDLPDVAFTNLEQNRFPSGTTHSAVPVIDPVTGQVRLVYGTDYGVFTGVDAGDGTITGGIGFSNVVNFNRNGNLQISQFTDGAVQPSQLAADLAGALFYGQAELSGFPVSGSDVLSTGNLNWRGPIGGGGLVQTDPTGTGTAFQWRNPFDDGVDLNTTATQFDFFRVFGSQGDPAFGGGVGQTTGLIGPAGASEYLPSGGAFNVNPLIPTALILSSDAGRVFLTTNQGGSWGQIGQAGDFGGVPSAVAFGSLLNPQLPNQTNNFLYAGTTAGRFFVTTTGGAPWREVSAGITGGAILRIVPDPQVGKRDVYAITATGVFYKADGTDTATPWRNITGNLFNITRAVFGNATDTVLTLKFLTSLAVDWRFATPVPGNPGQSFPILYVGGEGGVFKSKDQGVTWAFYPSVIRDGAPVDGGYLPNTHIMDLDLSIGDIDPTTGKYEAGGLNMLVATTYGRGTWAIRLDDALQPQSFVSGPRVVSLTNLNTGGTSNNLLLDFSSQLDPIVLTHPEYFRLDRIDGSGNVVANVPVTSVTAAGQRPNGTFRYQINFADQTAQATYRLTVGYNPPSNSPATPSVFDPAGNLMNQDNDTNNGEAGVDQYVRNLTLNGTAETLVVVGPPSSVPVNTTRNVTVQVQDINGGVITTEGGLLNVSINGSPAPQIAITNGQATLPISFSQLGTYTITLSDANPTQRFNDAGFTVQAVAGQAATLVLSPSSANVSTPPGTVFYTLTAFDAFGNPAAYNGTVTLSNSGNAPATFPGAVALNGTTTTFSVGVATVGTVLLTASAPGLNSSTATILVNPGPATNLIVTTSPGPFVAGGGPVVTVVAVDAAGNQTNVGLTGINLAVAPGGAAFGTVPATPAFDASGVATFTVNFANPGTYSVTVSSGNASGSTGAFTVLATPPVASPTQRLTGTYAVATGVNGSPAVQVYDATGRLISTPNPFPPGFNNEVDPGSAGFTGGMRVAVGDVTGDGVADYVVGTGPTITATVRVIDGATGQFILNFQPFGTFQGGVFVSVGDIDRDGTNDIVITPDEGGGPRVVVLRGGTTPGGGNFTKLADFFGIEDPGFRGGARAGVGDINGDGFAEVVVSAGFGGGPRVSVYDGAALSRGQFVHPVGDFFVFADALRNGAYIAVGDVDGDGFGDIIAGAGPGGGPRVLVVGGRTLLQQGAATAVNNPVTNFFAGNTENRGGVRVAAKNLDGDRNAEILTGAGDGGGSGVTIYRGASLAAGGFDVLQGFDALAGYQGGVFVG